MPKRMDLLFPELGVVRRGRVRVDGRGPFPSPWATNVRLEDSLTGRLRGGSFTGQATTAAVAARTVYLVTENGDNIVTENGDKITLGTQDYITTGDEGVWRAPGSDAPASSAEDCVYRDRVIRAVANIIHCSEQRKADNWTYDRDISDTGRPIFFQLSEAGEVGDTVVALCPHKDSFLLGWTSGETWVFKGDPTTGTLRNVSREVGIIAPTAWCKRDSTVYFLSSRGLYSVGVDGSGLKAVSADKVPEDLEDVTDATCDLSYYHPDRGVYIHRTGTTLDWFYDTEREGFWPFTTAETDSHVLLGPFRLGGPDSFGRILNMHAVIAAGSANVTWALVTGDTAESAAADGKAAIIASLASGDYSSYVAATGTWSAGRNNMAYPRNRAVWAVLWLSSAGAWAFESVFMNTAASGKWR